MDHATPRNRPLGTVKTVGWIAGAVLAGALLAILLVDFKAHVAGPGDAHPLPWWLFAGWVVLFYALYWVGFAFLLRTLRRHDAASAALIRELTEANENLELAQKLGRTGTWTAVRDGPITWTGSAAQLIGLPPTQTRISPQAFLQLVHPAERRRAVGAYLQALRTRGTLALDLRMQPPDGSLRWVSIRGAVSDDRSRIAGTIVDVTRQMHVHERLVATEHQFRALFEKNPLPFCVYDAETLQFLAVNDAVVAQFGYSRDAFLAMTILDVVPPDQREAAIAQVRQHAGERAMAPRIWPVIAEDGTVRQIRVYASSIRFQDRDAWLILAEDVTEQQQAHERLVAAEHQFRALFERNPLPFWVYDAATLAFLEVNPAAQRQYGYTREEFLRMTILDIRPPEDREQVRAYALSAAGQDWPREVRVWRHQRKDGSLLEVRIHAQEISFQGRRALLILGEDVSREMSQQRELAWRATHEPTTGLLNARALADTLQPQSGTPWRLAYVQLRGLELIEDSLGPAVGLRVMQHMARRLERLGTEYGEVGHVRPEEFVLAVRDLSRWNEALCALREELARPMSGSDSRQQLESWIGTAEFPGDHPDAMEAIRHAALAAHQARAEGRGLVAFEPAMSHLAGQRLRMAARLHRALEEGQFELHFQQIRRLEDGRPTGLEALLRWPQAGGGFIAPNEFIGVAEDTGMIVPLGRWVLREAARAHRRLAQAGHEDLSIAINVSQAQFLKSDLLQDFDEVERTFALPRGALHVELTESILMTRPEQARALLQQLQERGVCISLDDFGTGYSSMAYLHHLPIDALKLDRAFVHRVDADRRNASICQALLQLGHSLGLTVVAEGVETPAEYEWLRQHHCDKAQGYCIARPAPLDEVLAGLGNKGAGI